MLKPLLHSRQNAVQVLSTMLHPKELETVFGDVTKLYSKSVSDAFAQLAPQVDLQLKQEAHTMQSKSEISTQASYPILQLGNVL